MENNNNKDELAVFMQFLMGIGEALGHTLSPNQALIYYEALKDEFESLEEFKRASIRLVKTWSYSYMPKPAHFINALYKDIEIIAQKAWQSVIICLENGVGYTKTAKFEDNLIPVIVENYLGGFNKLGRLNYKELEFKKREFIDLYIHLSKNNKETIKQIKIKTLSERVNTLVIKANYIPPTNNKNKALKKDNNNINRLVNNIIKDKKI
jgi:hypothetical protein